MSFKLALVSAFVAISAKGAHIKRVACADGVHTATHAAVCYPAMASRPGFV